MVADTYGLILTFYKVLNEIHENGINIYHLPDADSDEDEDFVKQTNQLKVRDSSALFLFEFTSESDSVFFPHSIVTSKLHNDHNQKLWPPTNENYLFNKCYFS